MPVSECQLPVCMYARFQYLADIYFWSASFFYFLSSSLIVLCCKLTVTCSNVADCFAQLWHHLISVLYRRVSLSPPLSLYLSVFLFMPLAISDLMVYSL